MTRVVTSINSRLLRMSREELAGCAQFMNHNQTPKGMPLSFLVMPKNYWASIDHDPDDITAIIERLLIENSLCIYDAACGQIAQMLLGYSERADEQTQRLIKGTTSDMPEGLKHLRAVKGFTFNGHNVGLNSEEIPPNEAWFFRLISDVYYQQDPLDQKTQAPNFPTEARLHHEDWKAIGGEQAWAAMIGPLQVAYAKYQGAIPKDADEIKLALSILKTTALMQSPIGGIYLAPTGTHEKDPRDISNENNFSFLTALRMLDQVLAPHRKTFNEERHLIDQILHGTNAAHMGILGYLKKYLLNPNGQKFDAGGFYLPDGTFRRNTTFAVDVHTWGLTALGPATVDAWWGIGKSLELWQNTKAHAGYLKEGQLAGVGFTNGHDVLSGEWTFGAILMAKTLAAYYQESHPDAAAALTQEATFMHQGLEETKMTLPENRLAYAYANKRSYIPFGWWSNRLPSLASTAWAVMNEFNFNPFILGGQHTNTKEHS